MMYKIRAIDQLFFRSPVPFEAGGGSQLLSSYFPPSPNTYAGAFRMFLTEQSTKEKSKKIRIGYNGLLYQGAFCFPQPLDTLPVFESDSEVEKPFDLIKKHYALEKLIIKKAPPSNFPLDYYLVRDPNGVKENGKNKFPDDLYVSIATLKNYLAADEIPLSGFSLSDNLTKESKLGIEIGTDGTTEDSMLYQIEMIRPKDENGNDWELAVDVTGIETSETFDYVRLGGEGKVAQTEKMNQEFDMEISNSESEFFKLYFATPAIFAGGWFPRWIRKDMTGSFSFKGKKIEFKLLSAVVGKAKAVGGFDPNTKRPKELRYAVPAGSVYYFKIVGDSSIKDVKKMFHQKCLSDYREGYDSKHSEVYGFSRPKEVFDRIIYCDRGFGYALVGSVSKEQEEKLKCMKEEN